MKKLVAFVVVLSLGVFCAVGCSKPAPAKKAEPAKAGAKDEKKVDEKAPAAKADEKAPAAKPEEKKADEKK